MRSSLFAGVLCGCVWAWLSGWAGVQGVITSKKTEKRDLFEEPLLYHAQVCITFVYVFVHHCLLLVSLDRWENKIGMVLSFFM